MVDIIVDYFVILLETYLFFLMKRIESTDFNKPTKLAAVELFNQHPKRSLEAICDAFEIDNNPMQIAHLFHTISDFDEVKIGEFLSEDDNTPILIAYFAELDLRGDFLSSMRKALAGSLHLPSESEQIDHIIMIFAQCYILQNTSSSLQSTDIAYSLAFALIMLNSDLHSEGNRKKMKVKQFIMNTRNLIKEQDVPDKDLIQMYEGIRAQPFVYRNANLSPNAPNIKGILKKKSDLWGSTWKQHFFVLAFLSLLYYNSESENENPRGSITLSGVSVYAEPDDLRIRIEATQNNEIEYCKFINGEQVPVKGVKKMWVEAPSRNLKEKWLYSMHQNIIASAFSTAPLVALKRRISTNKLASKEITAELQIVTCDSNNEATDFSSNNTYDYPDSTLVD